MAANKETAIDSAITRDLPDKESVRRFFDQLTESHPADARKLLKKVSLLSDVLTIAAYSPLLATTILQHPAYIFWLERQRNINSITSKEELLESLGRFSLTNSQIAPHMLLSRFRRRELLRIYLRDIRRLGTIAETTEELSNLADTILEYALGIARQELENRYGIPLESNEKNRDLPARFCIISLGKLGSRELNYSSDVDLLFIYSNNGMTSGKGSREAITNREYFIKLAELITKIVGQQTGEGAAYRVDLRLRPYGRVGALAISFDEAANYYQNQSQAWERQTLIRARSSAGDVKIFKQFWRQLEPNIYSISETVENALHNVKLSKDKINLEHGSSKGFDVKLGNGGIREIEFIAQALQLAYGGQDSWLRSSHTLISLSRLADRELLNETELTELSEAYEFLRRLEHRLQMEHGLQTHLVPENAEKRLLVGNRMGFQDLNDFNKSLLSYTANVSKIFEKIFGNISDNFSQIPIANSSFMPDLLGFKEELKNNTLTQMLDSLDKSDVETKLKKIKLGSLEIFSKTSPYFAGIISANPRLIESLPLESQDFEIKDYEQTLMDAVSAQQNFHDGLAALRTAWTKCFLEIAAFDVFRKIDIPKVKKFQTALAEASVKTALKISKNELSRKLGFSGELDLAVLGLGKFGGRGMDYGSDLDLILVYDDKKNLQVSVSQSEFYSRTVEIFVTVLSSFTREGNLYRVDLRLRPDGKNGTSSISKTAFLSYLQTRSAIWEWLAYVKLRGVSGESTLAFETENGARNIIHAAALKTDVTILKKETLYIRKKLAQEKSTDRKNTDIKFSKGGLLDIYFAMRFLQLRDNVPDEAENRSTQSMLKKLSERGSLNYESFSAFAEGHRFLTSLDHSLRLTIGRSNSLPLADKTILQIIASRLNLDSIEDLFQKLSLHRIEIHTAFEKVLKD